MNSILRHNLYLIKEHIGMFRAANNYDIIDPETGQPMLLCREEGLNFLVRLFRFSDYKKYTPFHVTIRTPEGEKVLSVRRGVSFFVSKVEVYDEQDRLTGIFRQKFFSFGGRFNIYDPQDVLQCVLRGSWTSWEFSFSKEGVELAHVSKKWAGLGKEMFTSADNYVLSIDEQVASDHPVRILILAAVMCIDLVYKE